MSDRAWVVGMTVGGERHMDPFVVRSHDDLAKVLSCLLAAVALLGPTEPVRIMVEPYDAERAA